MADAIAQYRSAITDALGRVIPDRGDLRVWLDDNLIDRAAPDGWIHCVTAREVCFLMLTGRIVELSLDNDLDGDVRHGLGHQVIDFIVEQEGVFGRSFWPRDGITLHTANSDERDAMARAIVTNAGKQFLVTKSFGPGTQPHFDFATKTDRRSNDEVSD